MDPIRTLSRSPFRASAASLAVAAVALLSPIAASAQTQGPADPIPAADDNNSSEDLVVTARRRTESVQDVPIAISVVGGDQIDATGSFNVGRLQQLAPALQFYSSNPRNSR